MVRGCFWQRCEAMAGAPGNPWDVLARTIDHVSGKMGLCRPGSNLWQSFCMPSHSRALPRTRSGRLADFGTFASQHVHTRNVGRANGHSNGHSKPSQMRSNKPSNESPLGLLGIATQWSLSGQVNQSSKRNQNESWRTMVPRGHSKVTQRPLKAIPK